MRRLFTSADVSEAVLRWGERKGRWRRADRGVWAEGPEDLSELDLARSAVMATGGVASHHLAGVLHGARCSRARRHVADAAADRERATASRSAAKAPA